jgi:hypothetical protein
MARRPYVVILTLRCVPGGHEFEAKFRSRGAFDEQQSAFEIACPYCGDTIVEEVIMFHSNEIRLTKSLDIDNNPRPPRIAECILYIILPKPYTEYLPGDLEEEFRTVILPKLGHRGAELWYYAQVIRSILPLAARIIKIFIRTVTFGSIAAWVIRALGL